MARLPGDRLLIQQIGGRVILFEDHTEVEYVNFDPVVWPTVLAAQEAISAHPHMDDEEKAAAHFWSGYFYAYANHG